VASSDPRKAWRRFLMIVLIRGVLIRGVIAWS
jgi:hypothetical protein